MTRCPVPYALVALFGWGLFDAIVAFVRTRARTVRLRLATVAARVAE